MQPTIFIATPLEDDQVVRIFAAAEGRAIVVHEPDLLPPIRYVADHKGCADFVRTPEQQERWKARLAEADFLWNIPVPIENSILEAFGATRGAVT